jgi:hypothetical protein
LDSEHIAIHRLVSRANLRFKLHGAKEGAIGKWKRFHRTPVMVMDGQLLYLPFPVLVNKKHGVPSSLEEVVYKQNTSKD